MATYNSFKRIATDSIVDSAVAAADLANNAAAAGKFQNSAVTSAKIANLAVGATQLASNIDISAKTVTYRSILNADIGVSAAIAGNKLASGAANTNLGYTPLSRAGGTMTGALAVTAGSAGSAGIALSGQPNTGIFTDSANNIAFTVAGTTRMRINSAGHKTVGNSSTEGSIMWQATPTTGWTYANSYGGYSWREIGSGIGWDSYQRGGSNFSNSNGRFTAPVSGFYALNWQSYNYNDDNNTPNYIHVSFGRNGNVNPYSGRNPHGIWMHGTVANHANGVSCDLDLYLNQGEYASMFFHWSGGPSRVHGTHSIFNGFLIG